MLLWIIPITWHSDEWEEFFTKNDLEILDEAMEIVAKEIVE